MEDGIQHQTQTTDTGLKDLDAAEQLRETLKERKETQSDLKKQIQDKGEMNGSIRLCETPSAIATGSSGEGKRWFENIPSPILLFRSQLDAEERESEFYSRMDFL
jgi:hypothetical protein